MSRSHKFKSPALNSNQHQWQHQWKWQRQRQSQRQDQQQHQQQQQQHILRRYIAIGLLTILTAIIANINAAEATSSLIPQICDTIECPAFSDIVCPDDSSVRDMTLSTSAAAPVAAALLSPMISTEAAEEISSSSLATTTSTTTSTSTSTSTASSAAITTISLFKNAIDLIDETLIKAKCCLAKKCVCKTCYIPDCTDELHVVIELSPESMDTPGHCCGSYKCEMAPNCTEVVNTDNYWLTDCQRCKCYNGERICHESCDEVMRKSTAAMCNSKSLNTFFENGDVWKDGCYECECVNGEEKCVLPFCRSVNCPESRQLFLKNACCPICMPDNWNGDNIDYRDEDSSFIFHDNEDQDQDQDQDALHIPKHIYDDEDDDGGDDDADADDGGRAIIGSTHRTNGATVYASGDQIDDAILPDINFEKDINNNGNAIETIEKVETTKQKSKNGYLADVTTIRGEKDETTSTTPCTSTTTTTTTTTSSSSSTATIKYQNQDEDEEDPNPINYQVYPNIIHTSDQKYLYYTIISILGIIVMVLAVWNVHLRSKQRSYRPVSNFDDNFNKMSSNIKKMNDYV